MGSIPTGDDFPKDIPKPWIETPCLYSAALSQQAGCNIYLKLEALQPSGSFKSRGIGNLMACAVRKADTHPDTGLPCVHFYCSSGGNAGLACATAARTLGPCPATIVVPTATSAYMVAKLRGLGADVHQTGADWAGADKHLRVLMAEAASRSSSGNNNSNVPPTRAVYVPPFDHPDIWAGAATLIDEVQRQIPVRPDAFVCSVGGGGLMIGLVDGIEAAYGEDTLSSDKPRVLAVETAGADSLAHSVAAGELVTLPGITSIATSLGAVRVAERAFSCCLPAEPAAQATRVGIVPAVVSDAAAVDAIVRFLDDTRMLVEPACGAALAPVYTKAKTSDDGVCLLRYHLGAGLSDSMWATRNVVMVVCGGSSINLPMLAEYRERFGV